MCTLDCGRQMLLEMNEPFAAGFLEGKTPMEKMVRGYYHAFSHGQLPQWKHQQLYPLGHNSIYGGKKIIKPRYSFSFAYDESFLDERLQQASSDQRPVLVQLKDQIQLYIQNMHHYENELRRQNKVTGPMDVQHLINVYTGVGYSHAIINYERVLAEGLSAYKDRIDRHITRASDEQRVYYTALKDALDGILGYHSAIVRQLRVTTDDHPLIQAYSQVPLKPARNFFEAIVCLNFMYYVDGCDNPGRIDQMLWPFYRQDDAVDYAQAVELLREFYTNVDTNSGWSIAIGGLLGAKPMYNELTKACIAAAAGKRRPSVELRLAKGMDEDIWETAIDTLASGSGQPAFYNESLYNQSINKPSPR